MIGDQRLRDALRALPAEPADPAFTARVLARLASATPAPPRRGRTRRWATAAVVVVALAGLGWGLTEHTLRRQRSAMLRAETAALARELAALREEAAAPPPMIYLGGNEEVDLVLDLAALPMAAMPAPLSAAGGGTRR
jgi:hypothetical protein